MATSRSTAIELDDVVRIMPKKYIMRAGISKINKNMTWAAGSKLSLPLFHAKTKMDPSRETCHLLIAFFLVPNPVRDQPNWKDSSMLETVEHLS